MCAFDATTYSSLDEVLLFFFIRKVFRFVRIFAVGFVAVPCSDIRTRFERGKNTFFNGIIINLVELLGERHREPRTDMSTTNADCAR